MKTGEGGGNNSRERRENLADCMLLVCNYRPITSGLIFGLVGILITVLVSYQNPDQAKNRPGRCWSGSDGSKSGVALGCSKGPLSPRIGQPVAKAHHASDIGWVTSLVLPPSPFRAEVLHGDVLRQHPVDRHLLLPHGLVGRGDRGGISNSRRRKTRCCFGPTTVFFVWSGFA